MKNLFIDKEIKYTGKELSPHWIYKNFNICGDCIVSFLGEVDVKLNEMVDIEDVINIEPISSKKMLNFIIECFDCTLSEMVWRQRLFISIIKECLEKMGKTIVRDGDDLFFEGKKLSVSIATKSITSTLIHTALNVVSDGAPIEVSSLSDMGIDNIKKLAQDIMKSFCNEVESIYLAKCKVRGVIG